MQRQNPSYPFAKLMFFADTSKKYKNKKYFLDVLGGTWVTYHRVDFTTPMNKVVLRMRTNGCILSGKKCQHTFPPAFFVLLLNRLPSCPDVCKFDF